MDKKNAKVSNLYGRARRIELVEKIAYVIVGIIAVTLVFILVSRQTENTDDNVNFAYLRKYMEINGYGCEMIHRSGGQCILSNDNSTYSFVRYDDGFEYIINTKAYILNIRHKLTEENTITFKTTSDAFSGYRNKNYKCEYKDSVIGRLEKCLDEEDNVLDLKSYNGLIEQSMNELNNIIDASGYDKDELIENYIWQKK